MSRARIAVLAVGFVVVASGCTTLPQLPASASVPSEVERRECERNAGYWSTAAGFCRIGQ